MIKEKSDAQAIKKVIVLPDIHCPAEDKKTLAAVEAYLKDTQPDEIVYLGDFMDLNCISSHNKTNLRAVEATRLSKDFDAANTLLDRHEKLTPKTKKRTFITGNHDNRLNRYVDANPQLEGILSIDGLLRLKDRGYKFVPFWETGASHIIGKATFIHGEYVCDHHAKATAGAYVENVFYGHCFDDQTELLTTSGWRKRDGLHVEQEVMSYNPKTQKLEWNNIKFVNEYETTEKLHSFSGRAIDLLVTGEHGLLDFAQNPPEKYLAQDAGKKCKRLNKHAGVQDREPLPFSDDELRIGVWIAADGALENVGKAVRFHLKKARKIERLEDLLNRLGAEYSKNSQKQGTTKIYVRGTNLGKIWDLFSAGPKHLPLVFGQASAEQVDVILQEYAVTDGTKTGENSYQISTSKESEADLLQAMFVTSGYPTNKVPRKHNSWILSVYTKKNLIASDMRGGGLKEYSGKVWCVNVQNGTLLVRRNGKVCITQNTHDVQLYSQSTKGDNKTRVGMSLGCLCDYNQSYMRGKPSRWQQAFGVFYFRPGGTFNVYVPFITNHAFTSPDGKFYDGKELMRKNKY